MLKPSCAIQIAQDGVHKTISIHYYLLSLWRPIEDFMIVYDNLRQFATNIFRLKGLPASLKAKCVPISDKVTLTLTIFSFFFYIVATDDKR